MTDEQPTLDHLDAATAAQIKKLLTKVNDTTRGGRKQPTYEPVHEIKNLIVKPHVDWSLQIVRRETGALRTRWLSMVSAGYSPTKKLTQKQAQLLCTLMVIGIESARSMYLRNKMPERYVASIEPNEHTHELHLIHGETDSALLFDAVKRVLQLEDEKLVHELGARVLRRYLDNLDLVSGVEGEAS